MDKLHNPTLRVCKILDLIGKNRDLNLTDISDNLSLSKSTIQPILKTLVELNLLYFNQHTKTYNIGYKCYSIGSSFIDNNNGLTIIKNHMKDIVNECNEICQLGILDSMDNTRVFYIAKEEPVQSIKLISKIGSSLPAHATALGKCLLSQFDNNTIDKLYDSKKTLPKITERTVTNINDLKEEIKLINEQGFIREIGESSEGVECVAVPILKNNNMVASISVSLPTFRSSDTKIDSISKTLLEHQMKINQQIEELPLGF